MLTIAIPTMNRWEFLKDSLPLYLEQKCVKEVIVCDENGQDIECIKKSSFAQNPKLRLIKNDRRLGIYQNKRKCLSLATQPWVALLDSDNFFNEEWFETLKEAIGREEGKRVIFASADFRTLDQRDGSLTMPCEPFSGLRLNRGTWNSMFETPGWNFLLNDGNWVLPREAVESLPSNIPSENLLAADAIYMLRQWMLAGYEIFYVPGLTYLHVVHGGSSWLQTDRESTRIFNGTDWRV